MTSKRWLSANPLDGIKGLGRRNKGKPQPRINEARKWTAKALELAARGEPGAVAALMTLMMSLRCSEITERRVRDLDDKGRLLWITASKTEAGRRVLQVPKLIRPHLARLAEGKEPDELLFGHHWRDWPRAWVKRICRLVEIPEITAHGMRGFHASLAAEQGVTGHVIAQAMGHESVATTFGNYTTPEAVAKAKQQRVLAVLADHQEDDDEQTDEIAAPADVPQDEEQTDEMGMGDAEPDTPPDPEPPSGGRAKTSTSRTRRNART